MTSARLCYTPLAFQDLDAFHALVREPHIRRHLMDGQLMPREWIAEQIEDSRSLFAQRGVGVWLARLPATNDIVGFCGFLLQPQIHPSPQLMYAVREPFTRQRYATEMARACVAEARRHRGFDVIIASVDDTNAASMRLLTRLGFARTSTHQGASDQPVLFVLRDALAQPD